MKINRKGTAVLVMHWQVNMISKLPLEDRVKVLGNVAKVISIARECNMLIIYVVAQFRKGYPEVSARNTSYNKRKKDMILMEGSPEAKICSEVHPNKKK